MAFKSNDCQQLFFDDIFIALTEREKKALEKSWAKIFADEITWGILPYVPMQYEDQ